jgi:hypothetical protein
MKNILIGSRKKKLRHQFFAPSNKSAQYYAEKIIKTSNKVRLSKKQIEHIANYKTWEVYT